MAGTACFSMLTLNIATWNLFNYQRLRRQFLLEGLARKQRTLRALAKALSHLLVLWQISGKSSLK